ncbi:MAG: DUF2303 family protein [Pseudomonadota bacterium]
MTDRKTEIETAISNAKEPRVVNVNGDVPVLFQPPGWVHRDLTHLLPAPLRIIEAPVFTDPASFLEYYGVFAQEDGGTRIFADDAEFTFTSVFDGSEPNEPGHGDHRAGLRMDRAPEWKAWCEIAGKPLGASPFTRFIEKNLDYIKGPMTGAELLAMCRDLRIRGNGDISVKENAAGGERILDISMNSKVSGAGSDGEQVPFPEILEVTLRVFRNADTYTFSARLRWDVGNNGLTFTIDLVDEASVEEMAFDEVIKEVADATKQTVLKGTYYSSRSDG